MFEFVTISNGVAIVQHGATGHVYRFRPMDPGDWSKLALDRIDACQSADETPETHEGAALFFAEGAAAVCCGPGSETAVLPMLPPPRGLGSRMSGRPSTPRPEVR